MIKSSRLRFATGQPTEFVDLTSRLREHIAATGLREGRLHLQSLHTTLAVTINENEPLLLADFEALLDRLAPRGAPYQHDDFANRIGILPDEPVNGHAHCQHLLLGASETLPVMDGRLALGRWQRLFLVELCSARERRVVVQVLGA